MLQYFDCQSVIFVFWFPGKNPNEDYLEGMMNEAPGPINFTMFLTLFGERLQGTDPEDVIKNAFGWVHYLKCFFLILNTSENFYGHWLWLMLT